MRRLAWLALLAPCALGCVAEHMHPVAPETAIPVDPHLATVVFVRPHVPPAAINFTIVDLGNGGAARFLGESSPSSHFAASVAPGEHTFVAWGGGHDDAVRAKLEPGRVYVVALLSGILHPLVMVAVRRGDDETEDAPRWIEETTALAPDRERGQRDLLQDPRELGDRIDDALAGLKARDASEVAERTLRPEDAQ